MLHRNFKSLSYMYKINRSMQVMIMRTCTKAIQLEHHALVAPVPLCDVM